jgi:uncharacterized membrane protein YfcA
MDFGVPLGELAALVGALLLAGVVTGVLAGLLGVGGGGILVPVLYEVLGVVGVDEAIRVHLAVGTGLAVIVPTSLRSLSAHHKRGAVDMGVLRSMALGTVVGVGIGAVIVRFSPDEVLKGVWVTFSSIMAAKLFFGREDWRLGAEIPGQPFRAIYGACVGIISTMMSVGGGVFISTLMTLYGRPIHQAIGTSSGFGPLIAVPGAIGLVWAGWHVAELPPGSLGYVNLIGFAVIVPASVLSAPLGVRIAHGFTRRQLEVFFGCFLSLVGLRFAIALFA